MLEIDHRQQKLNKEFEKKNVKKKKTSSVFPTKSKVVETQSSRYMIRETERM